VTRLLLIHKATGAGAWWLESYTDDDGSVGAIARLDGEEVAITPAMLAGWDPIEVEVDSAE